jgi:hypothetical protein
MNGIIIVLPLLSLCGSSMVFRCGDPLLMGLLCAGFPTSNPHVAPHHVGCYVAGAIKDLVVYLRQSHVKTVATIVSYSSSHSFIRLRKLTSRVGYPGPKVLGLLGRSFRFVCMHDRRVGVCDLREHSWFVLVIPLHVTARVLCSSAPWEACKLHMAPGENSTRAIRTT